MQAGHLFGVILFMLQTSQIQTVGPIDEIGDGKAEDRDLPAQPMADGAESAGQGCSHQIVRKRPEVTLFPDLVERLALAQGNDTRHRKCIAYELGASGSGHYQDWSHTKTLQGGGVIDSLSGSDGDAHCRDIEQNLNQFRPAFGLPDALHNDRDDSDEQDLW